MLVFVPGEKRFMAVRNLAVELPLPLYLHFPHDLCFRHTLRLTGPGRHAAARGGVALSRLSQVNPVNPV